MAMKKLAVLCDYGLDDAIATTYLLDRADHFEIIDILPVGGNFPLETSHNNAKRVLSYYNHLKNVRIVDTSSVKQPYESLPDIHGKDGMGDVLDEKRDTAAPIISYDDWLKCVDEDYTVLSLGPCTVTEDILKKVGARPLILMCGNIAEPPNFNGYEFNHALDRKAFSECVKYPHASATLDSCHNPKCDFYKIDLDGDSLFYRFARRSVELSRERKESICAIYDLVAAVYLLKPEEFVTEVQTDRDGNSVSVLKFVGKSMLI